MSQTDFERVRHFGNIDPATLNDIVDLSPTLERWAEFDALGDDIVKVAKGMAVAYDAAIYSLDRHRRGDPEAQDLPIGACLVDPTTGMMWPGYARDQELNDRRAHAEVVAIRNYFDYYRDILGNNEEAVKKLAGFTMITTLEPCPTCLDEIEDIGISRVVFGGSRIEIENSQLVKSHGLKAPEIVREGRKEGKYPFEFFKFPHPSVQAACIEIFASFRRDKFSELVVFDPELVGRSTRYGHFMLMMEELREPREKAPESLHRQGSETDALLDQFLDVTNHFSGHVT